MGIWVCYFRFTYFMLIYSWRYFRSGFFTDLSLINPLNSDKVIRYIWFNPILFSLPFHLHYKCIFRFRDWIISNLFTDVDTGLTLSPQTIYSISQEICTRFCCALLCCGYAIVHNEFTWSIYPYSQGCFAGTAAIVRLPQCQWSKPDWYGKISQCITTTKHNKAKTVCIFLGYTVSFPYAKIEPET